MTAVGSARRSSSACSRYRDAARGELAASPKLRGRMKKQLVMMALGVIALGCSSDSNNVAGPNTDPASCNKGSISTGDTKTGQLGSASCLRYDYAYSDDSVYYDTYTFTATKGKGYQFGLENADGVTNFDGVLELATINPTTGEEQLVAISDDEGAQNYSRLTFIAPVSGTFTLRASGYDKSDTAAYKLTAKSCDSPLPQITGDLASTNQTLGASDCTLVRPEFFSDDSTHVKLYSLHIGPNETRTITVTSTAFQPGFQLYGPAWGVPCYYDYQGCGKAIAFAQNGSTVSATITVSGSYVCGGSACVATDWPGEYTLAVGSTNTQQAGAFTLQVSSGSLPPVRMVGPDAQREYTPTLNWLAKKPLSAGEYFRRTH